MAERIVLAQFDIDSRLLEDKIAQNQTKIDLLKGEIKDTRKAIKEYQDQAKLMAGIIEEGNKAIEEANQELAQGIITQEQYNYIVNLTSDVIRESEVELARLIETEREQQRQLVRYQTDLRSVNDENRELNNLLRAGRTEIQGNEGAYRELSQQLTATRAEALNLGAQMRMLEREGQQNTEAYRDVSRQWQESSTRARELHSELLELDRATGDNRRNVGNYSEGIKDAFSEIGVGFGMLLTGGFTAGMDKIKDGLKSIRDGLIAIKTELLANPLLTLAMVIVAATIGIYKGVKALFEYNAEIGKLNKEIEQLTNLTGPVVDRLREFATAIEIVFGKEFKEGIQEMNSLMKDFNLTSSEAFQVYQEGLAKGGAANAEFGDSIREYGVQFAQNGYSAQEFLNLLNAGIDLDVYTDKLPDAIKELGISFTDTTKATRDSLVNAFGASFTDNLLRSVNSGKISVKQALDEISAQAQKTGLNLQQIASLNASVFRGAGEDAGGLVKIIEAVNLANNKEAQTLTGSQKATLELVDATLELEQAKTKAFKSDEISSFSKSFEIAWTKIKTIFIELVGGIVDVVMWFDKMTGTSELVKGIFNDLVNYGNVLIEALGSLKGAFKDLLDAIGVNTTKADGWIKTLFSMLNPINFVKGALFMLTAAVKTFGTIIENSRVLITTFALTAKALFGQIASIANDIKNLDFGSALEKIKSFSISEELKKAREEAEKIVKLNKIKPAEKEEKAPDTTKIKGNDKDTGASADAAAKAAAERQKLIDKQQREAEAARKKAEAAAEAAAKQDLANAKERANVAIQATQAELADYIAMNAEKLKSDKRLTQARVNELQAYLENVREKTQIANELEKQQKIQSLKDQLEAIKGNSAQEIGQKKNLTAQKEVVEKEYATKELLINNEANDKRKELDKKFLEEKRTAQNLARALEFEKQIADLESQGYTEAEMQKVQLDQQIEQRLASFLEENELKRQLDQENYDLNAEIEAQRRELEGQIALEQDAIKKQNLQNLLAALNIMYTDYANKEKKIAEEKEYAKLSAFANVAGAMSQILGKQTVLAKTAAIAEATINTYVGASKALSQGGIWGIIQGAAIIAAGIANVASIAGIDTGGISAGFSSIASTAGTMVKKKAADGMLIGPSHSNGGIPIKTPDGVIEAEGGEVIINKRSSAMYRDVLSQINQLGGGVKFASGGVLGNISSLPTIQNNIKQNTVITLDEASVMDIAQAVYEGSQSGIENLSNNRQIQNGANF